MKIGKTFEDRYIPVTESGCWLWLGEIRADGYGSKHIQNGKPRRRVLAHCYSYELHNGPIPEGLQIDHLCRVRCCVNPLHLEAVDQRTNILRGVGATAINAAKTYCDHGHEFTDANTYRYPGKENGRKCRECRRRQSQEQRARRHIQRIGTIIMSFVLCFTVSTAQAADEVTLKYTEFKNMVSQCHSCRKAVAAYKEKDQAQAAVIESQKGYIETLEEGQRIQGALNAAYEAKLQDGELTSWYERGAWLATGAVVALVTKRFVPIWRGMK